MTIISIEERRQILQHRATFCKDCIAEDIMVKVCKEYLSLQTEAAWQKVEKEHVLLRRSVKP